MLTLKKLNETKFFVNNKIKITPIDWSIDFIIVEFSKEEREKRKGIRKEKQQFPKYIQNFFSSSSFEENFFRAKTK